MEKYVHWKVKFCDWLLCDGKYDTTLPATDMAWIGLARYHAQSFGVCIARAATGLEHDAAKTTGSRCGPILLILNNRAYVN